mgnify:CR=1 FL=1
MEKETMTNEVIETGIVEEPTDIMVDDYDDYYESEEGSNVVGNVIKVAAGAVITAGGIVVVKQREKIKAAITKHKIKSLEKKGYHVFEPNVEVEYEEPEDTSNSEAEITEEK